MPADRNANERIIVEALSANVAMRFLVSDQPAQHLAEAMATLGQFVGSWDLTMVVIAADGSRTNFVAEWYFGWALHGRAVQDVVITRNPDGELVGYGTTVRTYDDRDGKWWIVWQDPIAHEFAVLFARQDGETIMLDGQWPAAPRTRFRWVFSEITPQSFHWEGLASNDDGQSWRLGEVMDARRRPGA
ncbi:MAG: hypothetical protein M3295_00140 [Chloroflexota bacterium]|nr:hypothetical protein [Chloroflexota bacterium]